MTIFCKLKEHNISCVIIVCVLWKRWRWNKLLRGNINYYMNKQTIGRVLFWCGICSIYSLIKCCFSKKQKIEIKHIHIMYPIANFSSTNFDSTISQFTNIIDIGILPHQERNDWNLCWMHFRLHKRDSADENFIEIVFALRMWKPLKIVEETCLHA